MQSSTLMFLAYGGLCSFDTSLFEREKITEIWNNCYITSILVLSSGMVETCGVGEKTFRIARCPDCDSGGVSQNSTLHLELEEWLFALQDADHSAICRA